MAGRRCRKLAVARARHVAHPRPGRRAMKMFATTAPLAALAFTLACAPGARPARPDLRPVAMPDISQMNETVRAQVRDRYAALSAAMAAPSTSASELAMAYGDVGQILLAARYLDSAEPALLN